MPDHLWTGPRSDPRRYSVERHDGGPRHEPGGGGDGRVYRARRSQQSASRSEPADAEAVPTDVALKVLLRSAPADFGELTARLAPLAHVDDPRLMRVTDAFVGTALTDHADPDDEEFDLCWVVSEWVEGERLADAVAERGVRFALAAVADLADAVDVLHRVVAPDVPHGLVHRDVKTSNVRVRPDGSVVLIDFGLLRPETTDASVVGTPGWLAPEVAAGRPGGKPADVHGVGAVAHDLVVGEPPRLDGAPAARARLREALDRHGIDRADHLSTHLAALLATDPAQRPTDLGRWARELRAILEGHSPEATGGRRGWTVAAVVGVLLVAGIVALLSAAGDDPGDRPDAASTRSVPPTEEPVSIATVPCDTVPALDPTPEGDALLGELARLGVCAGKVERIAEATILPVLGGVGGGPASYLVASPDTPVVHLSVAQYASYRELTGRSEPDRAARFGGYPSSARFDRDAGVHVVELSLGGLLLSRRDDTQGFWLPQQVRPEWERLGGVDSELGLPTSGVQFDGGRMWIDFEGGYVETAVPDADESTTLDGLRLNVVIVDDPAAALEPFGRIEGRVLRQAGGTAWYIGEDRRRHWIADTGVWGCIDAEARRLAGDVPGYAVAALELGPPATCASAGE